MLFFPCCVDCVTELTLKVFLYMAEERREFFVDRVKVSRFVYNGHGFCICDVRTLLYSGHGDIEQFPFIRIMGLEITNTLTTGITSLSFSKCSGARVLMSI